MPPDPVVVEVREFIRTSDTDTFPCPQVDIDPSPLPTSVKDGSFLMTSSLPFLLITTSSFPASFVTTSALLDHEPHSMVPNLEVAKETAPMFLIVTRLPTGSGLPPCSMPEVALAIAGTAKVRTAAVRTAAPVHRFIRFIYISLVVSAPANLIHRGPLGRLVIRLRTQTADVCERPSPSRAVLVLSPERGVPEHPVRNGRFNVERE